MFHIIRTSLSITFLLLLTACFNDSDSKSAPSLRYHPSVTENFDPVDVEGVASKGILSQARVTIYAADDGSGDSLALGVGSTNSQGEYRIAIPFAYQGPIVVQIERDDPASGGSTQMVCDNAEGCGALDSLSGEYDLNSNGLIDFGERFPLSDDFRMRAVHFTSGAREAITVHVTPLTHLVDALTLSFGQSYSSQSILKADSHVADLFGLTRRLSGIRPLDLTNQTALKDVGLEQARYSSFAAAFAGLASHRDEFSGVLKSSSALFVANDGQFPLVDESLFGISTGFDELVSIAANLAEALEARHATFVELSLLLKGDLVDLRNRAEHSSFTDAVPSDSFNLDALDKAKIMVSEILAWQESLSLDAQHGIGFSEQTMELKTAVDDAQVATAFLAAAKYSPVLALMPLISSNEDAAEYFCDQVSGALDFSCPRFLANYDLQDFDCFSKANPLCELIADKLVVSVPTLEEGLLADYAVLAHTVHVYGFAYDQEVDLLFRLSDYDLNDKVSVTGQGEFSNDQASFSILGKVSLDANDENASFQGASEVAIAVSDLAGEDYSLSLRYGDNAMAVVSFEAASLSGQVADVTVTSDMEDWGKRSERVKIESAGKQLVFAHLYNDEANFAAINQDGVELTLDLNGPEDGRVGALVLGEENLASVVRDNGNLYVEFSDGEQQDITALIF